MGYSEYNDQIQGWLAAVSQSRGIDAEKTLENCRQIETYALQTNDLKLLGFSYYYSGETFYVLNDIERLFWYMTKALGYLEQSRQWELASRAYNLLAITSINRGNAPFAMDYYLNGLSYCKMFQLYEVGCIINMNIAALYLSVGSDKPAQMYLEDSMDMLKKRGQCQNYYTYLAAIYMNLGKCSLHQQMLQKAREYLEKIQQICYVHLEAADRLCLLIFEAQLYHEEGRERDRDRCIDEIHRKATGKFALMDLFDEFYEYSKMLFQIQKYQEFWQMIHLLEQPVKQTRIINLQRRLVSLKLQYYKIMQQMEDYLTASGLYYELSEIMEKENSYMISAMLNVRRNLDDETKMRIEAERENSLLIEKSQTDPLTGLWNRSRLDTYAKEAFARAKEKGSIFAVEMLDIDYFKQFNDNYGHQAGDECLIQVGKRIQKLEKHGNISVFRYGGDEFVVLYETYTAEQVKCFMQELKDAVLELQMEHLYSPLCEIVTVSQGAWAGIPGQESCIGEFLRSADDMLYNVKHKSRNSLAVGTWDGK